MFIMCPNLGMLPHHSSLYSRLQGHRPSTLPGWAALLGTTSLASCLMQPRREGRYALSPEASLGLFPEQSQHLQSWCRQVPPADAWGQRISQRAEPFRPCWKIIWNLGRVQVMAFCPLNHSGISWIELKARAVVLWGLRNLQRSASSS